MREGADGEGLPGPRAGDDPESRAWLVGGLRDPLGERRQLGAARRPEEGLELKPEGELDGLARRARRRDDDETAPRITRPDEGVVVRGEIAVLDGPRGAVGGGYGRRSAGGRAAGFAAVFPGARDSRSVVGARRAPLRAAGAAVRSNASSSSRSGGP